MQPLAGLKIGCPSPVQLDDRLADRGVDGVEFAAAIPKG